MVRTALSLVALALLGLAAAATASAHPGAPDRSFGHGGSLGIGFGVGPKAPLGPVQGWALAVAADGSTVAAGSSFVIERALPDGKRDRRFGGDGSVEVRFPGAELAWAEQVALLPSGKIVVAGRAAPRCSNRCAFRVVLARLTPGGRLDHGFGDGGFVRLPLGGRAIGLAAQPGGRLLLAASTYRGRSGLTRLRRNGRVDRSFGRDGVAALPPALAAAGLIDMTVQGRRAVLATVAHGGRDRTGSPADGVLVRYRADGHLDRDFGDGGLVRVAGTNTPRGLRAVAASPDGGLLVARSRRGKAHRLRLLRLSPDGAVEDSHRGAEVEPCPERERAFPGIRAVALTVLSDGAAAIAVACDEWVQPLRFLPGGALDRRFGRNGFARPLPAGGIDAVPPGLGATAGGGFALLTTARDWQRTLLARFGRRGPSSRFGHRGARTFVPRADSEDILRAMALAPGGGIVLAGDVEGDVGIARLGPDGRSVRRIRFQRPRRGREERLHVTAAAVQRDGKILVAARLFPGIESSPDEERLLLARFRPGGRPDRGFGGDGFVVPPLPRGFSEAPAMAVRGDGTILLAGSAYGRSEEVGAVAAIGRHGGLARRFGRRGVVRLRGVDGVRDLDLAPGGGVAAIGSRLGSCPRRGNCRYRTSVVRLRRDGRPERGFGRNGAAVVRGAYGVSVFARGNGALAVGSGTECMTLDAGNADHPCGRLVLARFGPSGLDPGFGDGGIMRLSPPGALRDAAVGPGGRIFVGGVAGSRFAVAAFEPDGSRWRGFGDDGTAHLRLGLGGGDLGAVAPQSRRGVLVAGRAPFALGGVDFVVSRLDG